MKVEACNPPKAAVRIDDSFEIHVLPNNSKQPRRDTVATDGLIVFIYQGSEYVPDRCLKVAHIYWPPNMTYVHNGMIERIPHE